MNKNREIIVGRLRAVVEGYEGLIANDVYNYADGDKYNCMLFDLSNNHELERYVDDKEISELITKACSLNDTYMLLIRTWKCIDKVYKNSEEI